VGLALKKTGDLRYGENPHQRGALYRDTAGLGPAGAPGPLGGARVLQGKDMSFNNWLDAEAASSLAAAIAETACVIVKHNNPCGAAVAEDVLTAYERARDADPLSAYGGVIVVNRPIGPDLGELLAGTFVEVLLAPGYDEGALAALTRKPNTRILLNSERRRVSPGERDLRRVMGGMLVQDRDAETEDRDSMTVATAIAPTDKEWGDLLFAWRVAKHVKSNAIVLARDLATVGVGAGQMSRVDSVRLATEKAAAGTVEGSSLASDAFFPFSDGPETAIAAGVTAIIQPGGSIRDDDVIAACDRLGAAMVFTGRRHIRH
jgi:phosphoribosylaminoimidazolecarboxamide formyltransferase/IMP cyclohydrolase